MQFTCKAEPQIVDTFYALCNEQGWVMFSPGSRGMAKKAPFLAVRFEFENSPSVTVESDTHPNPAQFFRLGGWQTRKYEDIIMDYEDKIGARGEKDYEYPMWRNFIRYKVRLWREYYRHLPRYVGYETEEPIKVVLVKLIVRFPGPNDPPGDYHTPDEEVVGSFLPDGGPAK